MQALLIDPKKSKSKIVDIDNKCCAFCEIIGCEIIDITRRFIGGKPYSIICDDCAFLKQEWTISSVSLKNHPLAGRLLIVNDHGEDLAGLTKDDINHLKKYITTKPYLLLITDAVMEG